MFQWLKKLFRRQDKRSPYIFHYKDGTTERSADPLAIEAVFIVKLGKKWREKLVEAGKPVPQGAIGGDAETIAAEREKLDKEILAAIDAAFDVHEYRDGKQSGTGKPSGLLEVQRRGLLNGYIQYCNGLREIARPFGNSQSRDAPPPEK